MHRFLIALLAAFPMYSETVGNVEFQLPPSNYEWRVFMEDTPLKIFTHREGDALEIFSAISVPTVEPDEEASPENMAGLTPVKQLFNMDGSQASSFQFVQQSLNRLGFLFPNHKLVLLNLEESDDNCLFGWECYDGVQDILHGYVRAFRTTEGIAVLHYITTAPYSETNRVMWTRILNRASSL